MQPVPDPNASTPAPEQITPQTAENPAPTADDIKQRLEFVLAGKTATIRIRDTKLTFKRWGLRKQLQMGAKVLSLVSRVQMIVPEAEQATLFRDTTLVAQVLSFVADDVIQIIAGSISSPFRNEAEAERWLDEEIDSFDDLFDLGYIVWEMNLKENGLGKLSGGVSSLASKMESLSMLSSKS